jgi:hypothetical protein
LIDTEVALLRQLHEAGWTGYTRLGSSSTDDPNTRNIEMLQGGSILSVFVSRPNEPTDELAVQTGVRVTNKSLPIPLDAGWIEYDDSTNLQLVINTKMDLAHTAQFYNQAMAAEGWLARDALRQLKDDKAFLPYIRGQQDVYISLVARPSGGTRIIVGDAARFSWQLKEPATAKTTAPADKPGIEAADFALPAGSSGVKFDVDAKQILFELADTTPTKLVGQFATGMEVLGWKRAKSGILSDEYALITFEKDKAEIQLRARPEAKATSATISGNGLWWNKPLPAVLTSFENWLRRNQKVASLEWLDEFAAAMHKIQAAKKPKP